MPIYQIQAHMIDIHRQAMIVDTNVLVNAFYEKESFHDDARYFLDEFPYQWLIPVSVIVETWGMLVGARKDWLAGFNLLAWLNTPGKAVAIIPQQGVLDKERKLIEELRLDCVDAIIGILANDISVQCFSGFSVSVATYDAKDFFILKKRQDLRIQVCDLRSELPPLD